MNAHDCAAPSMPTPRGWRCLWRHILSWAIVTLALTGCNSGTMRLDPPPPLPVLPANLTQPCQDLPLASSSLLPALLVNQQQIGAVALECQLRHAALAKAAREREALDQARYQRLIDKTLLPKKRH